MGNSASTAGRAPQDDTVDFGFLYPQGVYTGPRDWNHAIVTQLIVDRRLAPFYRPLEEFDESWDDDQILAARKEFPDSDGATPDASVRAEASPPARPNTMHSSKRSSTLKEPSRSPEAMVYRGAAECPICFLYYPPNINRSRCCDQTICTECFVQIKRAEPTPQHLVSEPAACPYCVQDNFGVVYTPPTWRAGIGSENYHPSMHPSNSRSSTFAQSSDIPGGKDKSRRKSFGYDSPEVVSIDHIRPDWEAKLAAVKAAVARRANRRIIMRQVGDRLIPVGVTSGRIHPLAEIPVGEHGEGSAETPNGDTQHGRRSRRRRHQQGPNQEFNQLLGTMGLGGQDLEELMVMEAMRLSLLEHEDQQRKEAEKKRQEEAAKASNGGSQPGESSAVALPVSSRMDLPPIPAASSPMDILRPSRYRGESPDPSVSSSGPSRNSLLPGSTPDTGTSSLPYKPRIPHPPPSRSVEAGVASALATALLPVRPLSSDGLLRPTSGASTPNTRRSPSPSTQRRGEGLFHPQNKSIDMPQSSPLSSQASPPLEVEGVGASSGAGNEDAGPSASSTQSTSNDASQLTSPSLNSLASSIIPQPYEELPSSAESSVSRLPLLISPDIANLEEETRKVSTPVAVTTNDQAQGAN